MRRLFAVLIGAIALGAVAPSVATAGQPSQDCANFATSSEPPGFQTPGFTSATGVYAATTGTHSAVAGNPSTVSQYDVACFEKSTH